VATALSVVRVKGMNASVVWTELPMHPVTHGLARYLAHAPGRRVATSPHPAC
jgi:hypothetical protein